MAIRKVTLPSGATKYEVVVDGPADRATGKRKQLRRRFGTRREATTWQARAVSEIGTGTHVGRDRTTVDAYLDQWLAGKHKIKPTTRANYADALKVARRAFGPRPLQDLSSSDVHRMVNGMLDGSLRRQGHAGQPLSPRAVKLTLTVLRMALEAAVMEGRLVRNVAARIESPSQAAKSREVWNGADVEKFLAMADQDRLAGAWRLSLHGLRRGEALGLLWENVDLDAGLVRVHRSRVLVDGRSLVQETTKTNAGRRVVPLTAEAVTALRRTKAQQAQERLLAGPAYADSGLVVVDALGAPVAPRWFADRFQALARAAGVPVVRLHDARHAYGSHLAHQGVPFPIIAVVMGHSTPAITASIYAHAVKDATTLDRVREASRSAGL